MIQSSLVFKIQDSPRIASSESSSYISLSSWKAFNQQFLGELRPENTPTSGKLYLLHFFSITNSHEYPGTDDSGPKSSSA